jgi:hypothetical protein
MLDPCGRGKHRFDAFPNDQALFDGLIRPKPDDASGDGTERPRLAPASNPAPTRAQAGARVGFRSR